ncbi:hypothetical protein CPC08DRAFT_770976 [Agrocybe pediades]|nr:hypothetical protein CPC08DRAFT_770976 [Agrocybe pediades]
MHSLQSLVLHELDSFRINRFSTWRGVANLPNLKLFSLHGHRSACAFLLDRIHRPSLCLVDLTVTTREETNFDFRCLDMVFPKTLEQNIEAHGGSQSLQYTVMTLLEEGMVLSEKLQNHSEGTKKPADPSALRMAVELKRSDNYRHTHNPRIFESFKLIFRQFSQVTTLYIKNMDTEKYYMFDSCLEAMPAVTTLEVCCGAVLYWLTYTTWTGRESSNRYHVVQFPRLEVIRVHINGLKENFTVLTKLYKNNKISEPIVDYVELRSKTAPIQCLEIVSSNASYDRAPQDIRETAQEVIDGLKVFPRIAGLKVRWTVPGGETSEFIFPEVVESEDSNVLTAMGYIIWLTD